MRLTLVLTILLVSSLALTACIPQSGTSGGTRKSSSNSSTTATPTATSTVNTSEVYWYSQLTMTSNLVIDASTQLNVYLRGSSVETYLASSTNFNRHYCAVFGFAGTAKSQLRVRALPVSVTTSSVTERYFRLEFAETSSNETECGGVANSIAVANAAFSPASICPTCSSVFLASTFNLYTTTGSSVGTAIAISGVDALDTSSLQLRINPQNNTTDTTASCDQSSCQALGYDCCLDGQCVNDGVVRPNASSDANYSSAVSEVARNPMAYINYPQLYYVCPGTVAPTATSTATPDAQATANALVKTMASDYQCMTCSSTPSNANCTNLKLVTGDVLTYSSCDTTAAYARIISQCGCTGGAANCVGYSLTPVKNTSGVVTSVECIVPAASVDPTPFQVLNVPLDTRTAPHRFFKKTDGSEVSILSSIVNQSVDPEGTVFSYIDPATKLVPQNNGAFNMNAILGQFATTLDKAQPAKLINVELGESYLISATSGYYTPCPSCAKDSWYTLFSANPATSMGKGLQAIGHTVYRDKPSTNYTYGNYEDTIWGRACFVPPTMIPFTHKAESNVRTQRQNRLKTQAALFVNGYQRDWYGFNKGALIGSFDGVTWFAIGKGRRVTATTTKLFLAINAPFADLATPSTINVHVIVDDNTSTAASYDYNPALEWNAVQQTEAASCQQYHQCTVDADCVSKLGWEYVCGNVTSIKTLWPQFDENANEKASTALAYNGVQILQGGTIPSGSIKRCMYRGAGAPCKLDYTKKGATNADTLSVSDRRAFACAPNFYCASASATVFNDEVSRYASALENLLLSRNDFYGRDAHQLGRPLYYMGNGKALDSVAQTNLTANGKNAWSNATDVGVCVPGKTVSSSSPLAQHSSGSSTNYSDFISQIGTCNDSGTHTETTTTASGTKLNGCPILDDTGTNKGNYVYLDGTTYSATNFRQLRAQNACSGESKTSAGVSHFTSIEAGRRISGTASLVEASLAKNACLRRAGAVCNSELDCFPNRMHANAASLYSSSDFGSTAEQKFFSEYLTCGQADPIPATNSSTYSTYDLTKNRCCREVGKDLTIYTQSDSVNADDPSVNTSYQSTVYPSTAGRYSRYSVLQDYMQAGGSPQALVSVNTLPTTGQDKTIGKTASQSCCGGGFIRKFADGTHDWTKTTRLSMDVNMFQCLNYQTDLVWASTTAPKQYTGNEINYNNDFSLFSQGYPVSGSNHYGSQIPFATESSGTPNPPSSIGSAAWMGMTVNTNPQDGKMYYSDFYTGSGWIENTQYLNFVPYSPVFVEKTYVHDNKPYFVTGTYHEIAKFRYPAYIAHNTYVGTKSNEDQLKIVVQLLGDSVSSIECIDRSGMSTAANSYCTGAHAQSTMFRTVCDPGYNTGNGSAGSYMNDVTYGWVSGSYTCGTYGQLLGCGNATPRCWWYKTDATGENLAVEIHYQVTPTATDSSIQFKFSPNGMYAGTTVSGIKAGGPLYYLNKLARFELLGIPQITYEPIACNSDSSQLIHVMPNGDGLFKTNSLATFKASTNVTDPSVSDAIVNSVKKVVYADQVKLDPVFSSSDFTCCVELGKVTTSAAKCCSNYAKTTNNVMYCKLPDAADLNVYFNRFVSSEPFRSDNGFKDTDFNSKTGEPSSSATSKLISLGSSYCASGKTREGAAFGDYNIEPIPPAGYLGEMTVFSILDSSNDNTSDGFRGFYSFSKGYRWNNHIYCDTSSSN